MFYSTGMDNISCINKSINSNNNYNNLNSCRFKLIKTILTIYAVMVVYNIVIMNVLKLMYNWYHVQNQFIYEFVVYYQWW